MGYIQMTLDDWLRMKESLKDELIGVKRSFVRIGYKLRKIRDEKLYERDGYRSISEFAYSEYRLKPHTVTRMIEINEAYSVDGYSDSLRPEFADFEQSKLEDMLQLPEEDREIIRPEIKREGIRELNRFNKQPPREGEADEIRELVEKFLTENDSLREELQGSSAYRTGNTKGMADIVCPSGSRTYRKGLYFLMMYRDCLKIKKYGGQPEEMSWDTFFEIVRGILEENRGTDHPEAGLAPAQPEPSETPVVTGKTEAPKCFETEQSDAEPESPEGKPRNTEPKLQEPESKELKTGESFSQSKEELLQTGGNSPQAEAKPPQSGTKLSQSGSKAQRTGRGEAASSLPNERPKPPEMPVTTKKKENRESVPKEIVTQGTKEKEAIAPAQPNPLKDNYIREAQQAAESLIGYIRDNSWDMAIRCIRRTEELIMKIRSWNEEDPAQMTVEDFPDLMPEDGRNDENEETKEA